METETILVLLGAGLIAAGVLGGGMKIWEIQIPPLNVPTRLLGFIVGITIIIGTNMDIKSLFNDSSDRQEVVELSSSTQSNNTQESTETSNSTQEVVEPPSSTQSNNTQESTETSSSTQEVVEPSNSENQQTATTNEKPANSFALQKDLIAYYPLDGNAKDLSGNSFHATNAPLVKYVAGKFGKAANFEQEYSHISAPIDYDYSKPLSVSFWFKGLSFDKNNKSNRFIMGQTAIGAYSGQWIAFTEYMNYWPDRAIALCNSNISIGLGLKESDHHGFDSFIRECLEIDQNDQYHHYVGIFNPNKSIKLYLDGKPVSTILRTIAKYYAVSKNIISSIDNENKHPLVISHAVSNSELIESPEYYRFTGSIDEIRLYNRVLSDAEVQQLYNGK